MIQRILSTLGVLAFVALLPLISLAQVGYVSPRSGGSSSVTANSITTAQSCIDAGASDTYACNLPVAPAYTNGEFCAAFQPNTANTGASSINFNSVGALAIKKIGLTITTDTATNDIRADAWVYGCSDGTNFQCLAGCDGNAPSLALAHTWAQDQIFGGQAYLVTGYSLYVSSSNLAGLTNGNFVTPDVPIMMTSTTSNSWHFSEQNDWFVGFDFNNGPCGTSACTDPAFIIHSAVQDTTQYHAWAAWGRAGGSIKTLTESAATSAVRIPVAALTGTGGSVRYTIKAADATDVQVREGEIKFAVVNKAGTETCTISAATELLDGSVLAASTGTLTYGITCDTTPANAVDIQFNAVSSLTQTSLTAQYFVTLVGPGEPARQ